MFFRCEPILFAVVQVMGLGYGMHSVFPTVFVEEADTLIHVVEIIALDECGVAAATGAFVNIVAFAAFVVAVADLLNGGGAKIHEGAVVQDLPQGCGVKVGEVLGIATVAHTHTGGNHAFRTHVKAVFDGGAGEYL